MYTHTHTHRRKKKTNTQRATEEEKYLRYFFSSRAPEVSSIKSVFFFAVNVYLVFMRNQRKFKILNIKQTYKTVCEWNDEDGREGESNISLKTRIICAHKILVELDL